MIPFQVMTLDQRWRPIIARKSTTSTQNYISTKTAGQCGFDNAPGTSINLKLQLVREQQDCSVYVRDIVEQDMLLTEALVMKFSSYRPDYQLDDYFEEAMVTTCESRKSSKYYSTEG